MQRWQDGQARPDPPGYSTWGVEGTWKASGSEPSKEEKAEAARGRCTQDCGGRGNVDAGQWKQARARGPDLPGTCRPFKLGLHLGVMESHPRVRFSGSLVPSSWWPSKIFVEWMVESIHYPRPPSCFPAI
uniref:Uncharacterized protein n=1 Tax=Molossus molossus TaxID=27622 RepID=A0A7J8DTE1_MOLMO|nr:hypothetical protein HJG59_009178 [Molossus molossus]